MNALSQDAPPEVGEFFDGNRLLVNQWIFNPRGMQGRPNAFDFPLKCDDRSLPGYSAWQRHTWLLLFNNVRFLHGFFLLIGNQASRQTTQVCCSPESVGSPPAASASTEDRC
jgi:hypothetical protein